MFRLLALTAVLVAPLAADLHAQGREAPAVRRNTVSLSGPRFGATIIAGALADSLEQRHRAGPVLTQFGWQFETRVFQVDDGITGMTELVGLVAGLEQGIALPTVSWLVALRGASGFEVGLGPNVSPAGFALVTAAGMNLRYARDINIPVNIAFAFGRGGTRTSILFGLNLEPR